MTKLEALAKDCIENHTHKLVDKPTKQDIYLREESIFIQGYRQSEERIAELEAQIEKLINFVLSKIECCDVCPIIDTCINSEGTCPYAGILAKGEEEVTREWIMQFISKEIKNRQQPKKMTKKELLEVLEGLDDEAVIRVATSDNDIHSYNITGYCDKVTGDDIENEICLLAE